jgi:hypothetical protein
MRGERAFFASIELVRQTEVQRVRAQMIAPVVPVLTIANDAEPKFE